MVFNEFLIVSDFFPEFSELLGKYGIPKEIFYIVLPFVGAYSTGITLSFVSLSFPILMNLGMDSSVWYGVAAFLAGYAGLMSTPVHLCAPMTTEFFKSGGLKTLIKHSAIASIPIMLLSVILLAILKIVIQ